MHFTYHTEIAKRLLDLEPDLINGTNANCSVLETAICKDPSFIVGLLECKPDLLLHRNKHGESALHQASKRLQRTSVNAILKIHAEFGRHGLQRKYSSARCCACRRPACYCDCLFKTKFRMCVAQTSTNAHQCTLQLN